MGLSDPSDLYVGMMKSRSISDKIIQRFDLQAIYEVETTEDARRALSGALSVSAGKDGFISVEFSDKDPELAAAVANAYVEELTEFNQQFALTEAAQRRLFFEQQLQQVKDALVLAENDLRQTQEQTGLIQPEAQGGAAIESVVRLQAQIAAKEVELSAMSSYATVHNPDYQRVRQTLAGLKVQLDKMQREHKAEGDALISASGFPEAGLTYMRKLRELKYQEELFKMLSKQFELAKIDEAKDTALIQVVDKAIPPEYKSKPKRALVVILVTLMSGFLAVLLAFVREAGVRAREHPERAEQLTLLLRYLKQGK